MSIQNKPQDSNILPSETIRDALIFVSKEIYDQNLIWAVTGSAALVARGVSTSARDIDIIATKEFTRVAANVLRDYLIHEFSYSSLQSVHSLFGEFEICGAKVQVMANVHNNINGNWIPHLKWQSNIEKISLNSIKLPVLTLKYEKHVALMLGNFERANVIEDIIRTN